MWNVPLSTVAVTALLTETVAAPEGEEGEDDHDGLCADGEPESCLVARPEKVKTEIQSHEDRVCGEERGYDYVALEFHDGVLSDSLSAGEGKVR